MNTKRYSLMELRSLIESFDNPMAVLRQHAVWMVNAAYLQLVGLPREQVEGRPAMDFVDPQERSRLALLLQRSSTGEVTEAPHITTHRLIPAGDGRRHEVAARSQEVELEDGAKALLINILKLTDRPPVLAIAERLVETSARLVSANTEEAVRRVALEGLELAGFRARFLRWDGQTLVARDEGPTPPDLALALEARAEGYPVFGGVDSIDANHVYLPVGDARHEVLWVGGPKLDPAHGSALALFVKAVGAALSEARMKAESARSQWELQAVARVARLVAQPVPPTPEAFLQCLAELLSSDAALLHLKEESGNRLTLRAHVGLAGVERSAAEALGQVLSEAVAQSEQGVLSAEAEERALIRASASRFGCGVAVRLTRGGELFGTLQLLRAPGRHCGESDLRLLGTVAELLVTLLEQHRLRAESTRQLTETRLLLDMARTTSGVLDSASILDVAADFLVRLLDVSNCFILLYEEQTKSLRGSAASATHRDYFRTVTMPLHGESLASKAARSRRSLAIEDLSREPDGFNSEFVQRFQQRALLAVPLTSREELIGVVMVDDTRGPRVFSPALIELAEATCGQLALSIANARLYESLWASYAELAAARAEMVTRERLAALGELSAIVAHEVRNPLGVIFNAVASLRRLLKPEGDAAMLLDILFEESDRLNHMVGDLLDYTRPREPILQPEDLTRVLQDSLEAVRSQGGVGSQPITLQVEVEPGMPSVPMDRRLIRQALINVVVNAVQSMPQGGVVHVRARREPYNGRESLRIDITDQGMGIPPELLHRVFEPFFTTKAQGTGLGLAVVSRILEEHRGDIAVESTSARGTTFTLRLPLSPPTPP
ncbi:ATP-binding protein [Hyalangium rubrum]|uniref:histidine kinase n=1 Tax=Hyalangium rubrum TaxID=3103134 RepID=A0ABU5H0Q9_9BACT|nr:ATP-binding protein [Hyalangium sp. s54d21]MDY7226901.1 ATP-binding protein [Hyalangium sp. s54d21]